MSEIILHHYEISVFSERVRLALGLKRLSWNSVTIPHMLPKPDLMPLTGGYRRTPVMQLGADIYCDTLLILRKSRAARGRDRIRRLDQRDGPALSAIAARENRYRR